MRKIVSDSVRRDGVWRIGTDCSGIEAPIQALVALGIPFAHVFSSEIDKFAIQSIRANYSVPVIYGDITKRDHLLLPDIDLYVCGFPCQPFSLMGLKKGTLDSRGSVMWECVRVIKSKRPQVFVLENVKNFKYTKGGLYFRELLAALQNIPGYTVDTCILNTSDYGIPQNRERLFFIGTLDGSFQVPDALEMRGLPEFLVDKRVSADFRICKSLQKNLDKIGWRRGSCAEDWIVSPFTFFSKGTVICPTLTTNCGRLFYTKLMRNLSVRECLMLQGFPADFIQVVSNSQLYKQVGNSMSVNVLVEIFRKVLL